MSESNDLSWIKEISLAAKEWESLSAEEILERGGIVVERDVP